jgi:hypothetical protein
MKHSAKYLSGIVLGLMLVLSAVPGHADNTKKIKVTIPFDFVVGSKQLKAGNYVVQSWGNSGDGALLFRFEDGGAQQIVFAVPVETNKTGNHERLVFHRYGGEQFAAQVWFMGNAEGYELIPGSRERESAANHAAADQLAAGQKHYTVACGIEDGMVNYNHGK